MPEAPTVSVCVPSIPSSNHTEVVEALTQQDFVDEYELFVVNDSGVNRAEARNVALRLARSEIVAFIDDDCIPDSKWLSSIVAAFREHNGRLGCLEGAVTGGINYTGTRKYVGCNLSVDRDAAREIGGFDSEYSGWREDTEFGWRMERYDGVDCAFASDVQVTHPTRPRAGYIHEHETRLKSKYPNRYSEVMNGSIMDIGYRWLQRHELLEPINRLRYREK